MINFFSTARRTPTGEPLAPDPLLARWQDRVNRGARFRLNLKDMVLTESGKQSLLLPLARPDEEGTPLSEIALNLYNVLFGAALCHTASDVLSAIPDAPADSVSLSYGDIVDYLQQGVLRDRIPCTPPWGYPPSAFGGDPASRHNPRQIVSPRKLIGAMETPDQRTVPVGVRRGMQWTFHNAPVAEAGIVLVRSEEDVQYLWINYRFSDGITPDPDLCNRIAHNLYWWIPRHYAAIVMVAKDIKGDLLYSRERDS